MCTSIFSYRLEKSQGWCGGRRGVTSLPVTPHPYLCEAVEDRRTTTLTCTTRTSWAVWRRPSSFGRVPEMRAYLNVAPSSQYFSPQLRYVHIDILTYMHIYAHQLGQMKGNYLARQPGGPSVYFRQINHVIKGFGGVLCMRYKHGSLARPGW